MTYGIEKNLYRVINTLLMAAICILGAGRYIGLAECTVYHVVICILVTGVLAVFCFVKLKGKLIMAASLTGCLIVLVMLAGWSESIAFVITYGNWLVGNVDMPLEWQGSIEALQVTGVSLLCFLLQLVVEKLFGVKIIISVVLLFGMFVDMLSKRELEHLTVVCVLGFIILTYTEWTQKHWKKHKCKQQRMYMLWMMPFLILYMIFMLAMPTPKAPYDWKFVKELWANLQESFLVMSQDWQRGEQEDFAIAQSGFSDSGMLLGALEQSDQEVMRIQGQKSLKTNVYLVGKTYDTFDGQQWLQSNEATENDRLLDTLETMYAIRAYDFEQEEHYVHSTKLHVRYQYFDTGYLFAPLKAWKVTGKDTEYQSIGGNLVLDDIQGYGMEYDVNFVQINVDHSLFYEFLEDTYEPDEAMWKSVRKEFGADASKLYTLEDIEQHRVQIEQYYGDEVEVSAEVSTYMDAITEEAQTMIQKLKAIEAELSSYTYTLTPGALPEDISSEKEFLDYFLLDSRQGYCSYFATAFVLLARAEGLPARYVEGFCVPIDGTNETIVYSSMAHSWPEVYIEGIGWIPFEPTPGYERIRYTPWEVKDHVKKSAIVHDEEEEEESVAMQTQEAIESEMPQEKQDATNAAWYIVLIMLLIVGLVMITDFIMSNRRYRRLSIERKFELEIHKNLRLLEVLGYRRGEAETLEELQQRAWALVQGENEEIILQFLRMYEDVVYGKKPVKEEMLAIVQGEKQWLLCQVKKWKKSVYWYYKYFRRY